MGTQRRRIATVCNHRGTMTTAQTDTSLTYRGHTFQLDSRGERFADGAVHIIGVLVSLIAVTAMIVLAAVWQDGATIAAVIAYGLGTCAVFGLSAAYHLTPPSDAKAILRRFDHAAIFVKIAGTYTPFAALAIGGLTGHALLIGVWAIAVIGVSLKLAGWRGGAKISVALYLIQGWLLVFAIGPLNAALTDAELILCLLGGGIYTAGCTFYLMPRMAYNTAVWHLFVLVASACFYAAILMAVVLR